MDDDLNQIERLFALKERGLLSDEEFQIEKSKLLGGEGLADANIENSFPEDDFYDPEDSVGRSYKAFAALLVVALGIGGLLWLVSINGNIGEIDQAGGKSFGVADRASWADASPNEGQPTANIENDDIEDAEENAPSGVFDGDTDLERAFSATLGQTSSNLEPQKLISVGPSVFAVIAVAEQDGAHSNGGLLAIQYAKLANGVFSPFGRAIATETGSFGSLENWETRENLTSNPIVIAYGGGTWQGCTSTSATLIELTPERPLEQISFPVSYEYDDGSSNREFNATIVKGRTGIDVRYAGDENGVVRLTKSGTQFTPQSEFPVGC